MTCPSFAQLNCKCCIVKYFVNVYVYVATTISRPIRFFAVNVKGWVYRTLKMKKRWRATAANHSWVCSTRMVWPTSHARHEKETGKMREISRRTRWRKNWYYDIKTCSPFCHRYFKLWLNVLVNKVEPINYAKLGQVRISILLLWIAIKMIHFKTLI